MFLLAAILSGLVADHSGASVRTDNTGRFTTPDLPPGTYHPRVSQRISACTRKKPIEIQAL